MALKITPGSLPADGETVDVADDLESFVQNTEIENIDESALADGISLVVSQTDFPGGVQRGGVKRGTLWFRRGQGRLFIFDTATPLDDPSEMTNADWLQVGGGRQHFLRILGTQPARMALSPASTESSTGTVFAADRYPVQTYTGEETEINYQLLPLAILAATQDSGGYRRAGAVGFFTCLGATGISNTPGPALFGGGTDPSLAPKGFAVIGDETDDTNSSNPRFLFHGFVTSSNGSNFGLRTVFMKPRPTTWSTVFTDG